MRKISVEGPVCRELACHVVASIEKLDKESNEDIYLVINGPGGCCLSMLGIVDAMRRAKSKVGAIVVGRAMSADCLILASAEKGMRLAFPNSVLMIHEPRGGANILSEQSAELMELIDEKMKAYVKGVLKLSEEELDEFFTRDQYMFADKAMDLGFIDGVIDDI